MGCARMGRGALKRANAHAMTRCPTRAAGTERRSMRTTKRCSAEQFDVAVAGRQFTPERLKAARLVLVDGVTVAAAAEATGRTHASVTQAVQLIFNEVKAAFKTVNPNRSARPGFSILTVEVPQLAVPGLVAGLSAAGGLVLEEKNHAQ